MILGKVHDVGYMPFLLGIAESLGITCFSAENISINGKQAIEILLDDKKEKLESFIHVIGGKFPENAVIEKIEVGDYEGNVMKTESYYRYLSATQLTKIATYGGIMLEKQGETISAIKSVKEDTTAMLAKQDKTIEVLESVKDDTSLLPSIREDTSAIKRNTKSMPEMFSRIFDELDRIRKALIKAGIEI